MYIASGEEEKIVIVCGYDGAKAEYLNSVYEYNITKNKVSILFLGSKPTDSKLVLIQNSTTHCHLQGAVVQLPLTGRMSTSSEEKTLRTE